MVALHHFVPGKAIANKVAVVSRLNVGCLLVNAVVAANEDIMDEGHMGCVHRIFISLRAGNSEYDRFE